MILNVSFLENSHHAFFSERLDLKPNFLDDVLYYKTISYSVLLLLQVSSIVSNALYYTVSSSTVKFIIISIKKNKSKIRPFQLVVNPAFSYLIHFTVRKTCIDFEGLWISRKATFHCIAIWVFNWNSKWLTTTSWKSNNGWTSCYRRWVNFSVIWSWNEVYFSFYFPICGTSVMT